MHISSKDKNYFLLYIRFKNVKNVNPEPLIYPLMFTWIPQKFLL